MDSDKAKKDASYLPRSWGSDREERRTESQPQAPEIPDDSSGDRAAVIDSARADFQESTEGCSGDFQPDESGRDDPGPAEREDDEPTKAHILETPINIFSPTRTATIGDESVTGPEPETPSNIQPPGLSPAREDLAEPEPQIPQAEDKRPRRVKINIVGVRFGYACKVYRFDAGDLELNGDDWVIVKTEKGLGLGRVAMPPSGHEIDASQLEGLRKVIRKAGKVDFDQKARLCPKRA